MLRFDQGLRDLVYASGELSLKGAAGTANRGLGVCIDQVSHSFGLRQIEFVV